jgi:large subunit ribosomal protein L29
MKPAELREMPDDELIARMEDMKEELFNLRFQMATGQLDNPMRIKQVRHDIARVMTVLRDREIVDLDVLMARADAEALEERRAKIASGELKGVSLAEAAEEQIIEAEAAAGASGVPDEDEERP